MAIGEYSFDFRDGDQAAPAEVFADPTARRRKRTRRYLWSILLIATAWTLFFFHDTDVFRLLREDMNFQQAAAIRSTAAGHVHDAPVMPAFAGDHSGYPGRTPPGGFVANETCDRKPAPLFSATAASLTPHRVFAFLPSTMEWAHLSLKRECGAINVLMPDWFVVTDPALTLAIETGDPEARGEIAGFLKAGGAAVELFPTIQFSGDVAREDFIGGLLDRDSRAALLQNIENAAMASAADGLCLDLARLNDQQLDVYQSFLKELGRRLEKTGVQTCVVMSATDAAWTSPKIHEVADYVVVKFFAEPWVGSPPAPLAGDGWFRETAAVAVDLIGPAKLVAAMGTASVDWVSSRAVPETIGYGEALSRIARAGGVVKMSASSANSYSSFLDQDGLRHQIWMLDAVTAHNQLLVLENLGVENVALWGLGTEDPGLWRALGRDHRDQPSLQQALQTIQIDDYVTYSGDGPFLRVLDSARSGYRDVSFEGDSLKIVGQDYLDLPQPVAIERHGRSDPNKIVLTFDDGPHPEYTEQILDVLLETNTPATFFMVGSNVLQSQGLVRRMVEEGHEIGSHTFWHPHMSEISETRKLVELSMFQKLVGSVTGHETLLFREPYQRSSGPIGRHEADPISFVQNEGYIIAGSDITPPDWEDISADDILAHVLRDLEAGAGNVIVLHDAGNDRGETVKAVAKIIPELRAQGYEFVSLANLLDLSAEDVMPSVDGVEQVFYNMSFNSIGLFWKIMVLVFWAAIAIGAVRSVGVLILALLRKPHTKISGAYQPPVTVVIPAYNEEAAIRENVESVLALKYPNLKVLIVDDGSLDATFPEVLEHFGRNPRVKIIAQLNQGKWSALNTALRAIDTEIAICIDADTRVDVEAVNKLVSHFQDTFVGAVAGKVVIGNRTNLLTRLQALEYITAQNIDRRAAEYLNAMLVVPGAIGAWRVSAVQAAGGYSGDTLTEDADLTMSLLRTGYRIVYEERAIATTSAPPRVKALLAQRLRWSLGMLQAGWKHRGAILQGKGLGFVALPDLLIFGYLLPILAPFADFFFLKVMFDFVSNALAAEPHATSELPRYVIAAYIALPLMDVITATTAMAFDHRENKALILLFPLQRFFYRQLLYYSVLRALLRALSGRLAKWTKAHRIGAATSFASANDA